MSKLKISNVEKKATDEETEVALVWIVKFMSFFCTYLKTENLNSHKYILLNDRYLESWEWKEY